MFSSNDLLTLHCPILNLQKWPIIIKITILPDFTKNKKNKFNTKDL